MFRSNNRALLFFSAAGICLLSAGFSGSAGIFGKVGDFLVESGFASDPAAASAIQVAVSVLAYVGSLGGIAVIFGGDLVVVGRRRLGKFVAGLGTGTSLFGVIFMLATDLWTGNIGATLALFTQSVGWLGVFLSILAQFMVEK